MAGYMPNPDLGPPARIEPLLAAGKIAYRGQPGAELPDGGIYHVGSPYELTVPIEHVWPQEALRRHMRLVVTLYDLIPEVFADFYLADPGLRRRYRARQQLVRAADHVVALSRSTADDAADRWDLDPDRITVIGAGVAPWFQPPTARDDALAEARRRVSGLEARFVM